MAKYLKSNNFIIAAALYVAWVIVYSFYNYHTSKVELLDNLEHQLEVAARNYLTIIPENLHHKNMSKSDLTKEEDYSLLLRSNEFAKTNSVFYIYSMIKKDNKIYFTMGNGTDEDMADLNGGGYYFYPYTEAEPHIYKAFEVDELFFHDTIDTWGKFRSVFIPYIAKDGTKFVIGADITTSHINELLVKELVTTVIISILFLIFVIPLLLVFTSEIRKWAKNLETQTAQTIANDLKLSSIVKLAVDAIITIDNNGLVTDYNDSAYHMFGYSADEVIGNNIKILMLDNEKAQHDSYIQAYFHSGTGKGNVMGNTREFYAQRKNGETFPIEVSVSEIVLNDDEQIFSAIIRDLTEKKEKEKQLHSLVDKAEAANKAKSDFISKMSHELRTPLHGILAFSSLDVENKEKNKIPGYFSKIHKSAERLKTLLDDLLDFSELEAGKMEINFSEQNVKEIIYNCILEQQALINKFNLNIVVNDHTDNNCADLDIARITQVILNLLNNAIKFSPENSTIKITISNTDVINNNFVKALQFSISDEGNGIPEEDRENIFSRFTQANVSNDEIPGTGLGLAIAQEIIHAHNGSIWCKESESNGAEFIFRIPVHNN